MHRELKLSSAEDSQVYVWIVQPNVSHVAIGKAAKTDLYFLHAGKGYVIMYITYDW